MLNTTFILRNGSMEHNGLFACSQVKVCGQNCQVYIFLFLQYLHKGKILTNQLKGHYSHSLVTSDSFLFQLSEEGHKLFVLLSFSWNGDRKLYMLFICLYIGVMF